MDFVAGVPVGENAVLEHREVHDLEQGAAVVLFVEGADAAGAVGAVLVQVPRPLAGPQVRGGGLEDGPGLGMQRDGLVVDDGEKAAMDGGAKGEEGEEAFGAGGEVGEGGCARGVDAGEDAEEGAVARGSRWRLTYWT